MNIVLVGAGPTGISAAAALLERGCRVLLIDAGEEDPQTTRTARAPLSQVRAGRVRDWDWQLGRSFGVTSRSADVSPKLRIHSVPRAIASWMSANYLDANGFVAVGQHGIGGLSRLWGAMAPVLTNAELVTLDLPAAEIGVSYVRLAQRIGLSGPDDTARSGISVQPPLPLSPGGFMLEQAWRHRTAGSALRLGRPVQAVQSRPERERGACIGCGGCLWGCPTGAIYDATQDLAWIARHPNFQLRTSTLVERIERNGRGYRLICRERTGVTQLNTDLVVLAAGHLVTTRLALELLRLTDRPLRMENAPAFAFAILQPKLVATPVPEASFGMAQLTVEYDMPAQQGASVHGAVYDAASVAPSDLFAATPLGLSSVAPVAKALLPALSIVFCYLPGYYSQNTVTLRRQQDGGSKLMIEGRHPERLTHLKTAAARAIIRELRKLGAYGVPGSLRVYQPGAEVHAGAVLGGNGLLTRDGELKGAQGIFAVDLSALPGIPAKHPTFTAMANADRIARGIAAKA